GVFMSPTPDLLHIGLHLQIRSFIKLHQLTSNEGFYGITPPPLISFFICITVLSANGVDYFLQALVQIFRLFSIYNTESFFSVKVQPCRQCSLYCFSPAAIIEAVHPAGEF